MRRELMGYLVKGFGGDILLAQRCWCGCKLHGRDIWREDSQNRRATTRTYA